MMGKGLDPPAKAATNTYARTNAVVTTTNYDMAHACTRPAGGLPSMIRAHDLRLGLSCLPLSPPAQRARTVCVSLPSSAIFRVICKSSFMMCTLRGCLSTTGRQ
jgi:hypothetical protein